MKPIWKRNFTILAPFLLTASGAAAPNPVNARPVAFFDDAVDPPHLALIAAARIRLDIEIYTMDDPAIRAAIYDAARRGVRVRIVQEPAPVGRACRVFDPRIAGDVSECDHLRTFVSRMRAAGAVYLPFAKPELCLNGPDCFEHGKSMIVDRVAALISTGNFDRSSVCDVSSGATRCNRDFAVVTRDAADIATLESVFESDLAGKSYDLSGIVARVPAGTLTISPYSLPPLVAFIRSATRSIDLENQYLHDADLNRELEAAARRGVRVRVMVASLCSFGNPSPMEKTSALREANEFETAGIAARAFTGRTTVGGLPGYLHAKAIVVDSAAAWVGSVNGSETALSKNREYGLFFGDPEAVSDLERILAADFDSPGNSSFRDDLGCSFGFKGGVFSNL